MLKAADLVDLLEEGLGALCSGGRVSVGTRDKVPWCLAHPSAEGCESSSGTLLFCALYPLKNNIW